MLTQEKLSFAPLAIQHEKIEKEVKKLDLSKSIKLVLKQKHAKTIYVKLASEHNLPRVKKILAKNV